MEVGRVRGISNYEKGNQLLHGMFVSGNGRDLCTAAEPEPGAVARCDGIAKPGRNGTSDNSSSSSIASKSSHERQHHKSHVNRKGPNASQSPDTAPARKGGAIVPTPAPTP